MSPLQGISRLLASRTPTWEQTIEEPKISEQHQQLHEIWTNNRWTNMNSRRTNNRWTKLTTSLLVKLEETFSQSCYIYAKKSLSYQLNLPEESAKVTHWKNCIENGGSSERVWELEGGGVERPLPPIRLVGLIDTRMTRNFMQWQNHIYSSMTIDSVLLSEDSSALSELKFKDGLL